MNAAWIKYLPGFIRIKLKSRHGLQAIIANTGWLFADKILRMGVGLFVGVWIARYLGPEQFGLWNFAMAFAALFGALATLGLDSIVVRELVKNPERQNELLGSAFALKLIGGAITLLIALITISLVRSGETLALWLVGLSAAGFIFQSVNVINFYFQAKVQSRYTVYAANGAFLLMTLVKIALLLTSAPLIAFAWAGLGEVALTAIFLLVAYRVNHHNMREWRYDGRVARELLKDSWPLLLSGSLVLINMSIDKVMLGQMANGHEVGLYSAANVFVVLWYFIPTAIVGSAAPKLIQMHTADVARYDKYSKKIYKSFGGGTVVIALIFSFFSDAIVSLFYGEQYDGAGAALAISIWAIVFVFQVSFRGRLLVIEGMQAYITLLVLFGTISNVLLNIWLIPSYGAVGAAYAYTISWGMSAFVFPFFFKKTRHHAFWCMGLNSAANR